MLGAAAFSGEIELLKHIHASQMLVKCRTGKPDYQSCSPGVSFLHGSFPSVSVARSWWINIVNWRHYCVEVHVLHEKNTHLPPWQGLMELSWTVQRRSIYTWVLRTTFWTVQEVRRDASHSRDRFKKGFVLIFDIILDYSCLRAVFYLQHITNQASWVDAF